MRWTLVFLVGVLLLALPARAGRQHATTTLTIRLIVTPADSRYLVDHAPKSYPNKGDVIRETSTLRNAVAQLGRPKGAIVGSDIWITTIVIPPFGKAAVRDTSSLPGGTIRAVGAVAVTQPTGTFQVAGGTGKYANARGTISLRNLNVDGSRGLSVYRLQVP